MKIIGIVLTFFICSVIYVQPEYPYLQKAGYSTQLIVEGKPFFILGGELGNSSFTSLEYMAPIWPRLVAMHLNGDQTHQGKTHPHFPGRLFHSEI